MKIYIGKIYLKNLSMHIYSISNVPYAFLVGSLSFVKDVKLIYLFNVHLVIAKLGNYPFRHFGRACGGKVNVVANTACLHL